MSIQTNSPSTNLGTSVSADEIAQLLGFADAAAMVAASVQYVLATGGTTNYVAAPALALTPVNGTRIAVRFPSNCAANATLNVSGSGAKAIMLRTLAGERATTADDLLSGGTYIFTYMEDFGGLWVETGGAHLKAADIPSTLNATTFAGNVTLPAAGSVVGAAGNASYTYFCGGNYPAQSAGAFISLASSGWTSSAIYYTGNTPGARHSFRDYLETEQIKIDENGTLIKALFLNQVDNVVLNGNNTTGGSVSIGGGSTLSNGANIRLLGSTNSPYPGAHQQFAPLSTRAASTAFALCPVATGDRLFLRVLDNIAACPVVHVFADDTIIYESGTTGSGITYINSSSPGSTEIGIYISAGVVYLKPGSSLGAYKAATFSLIGKA